MGRVNIVSMFYFLKTDVREQKSMKRECRHLWIIVNDLCHELKFENCVKDKINFFVKQNISFLNTNIF